jgi:hypothetical protein
MSEIIPRQRGSVTTGLAKLRKYLYAVGRWLKTHGNQILGIVSITLPLGFIVYCLWSYSNVSPGADIREMNELNKTALQINVDTTHSLANLTVGLAGGVWVLLFTTDKLPRIKGRDLVPLIGGSLSLVFSYICYRLGLNKYIEMLFDAQTVDLSAGFIRYWPVWQVTFFGFGFAVLVLALFNFYRRDVVK